MRLKYPCWSMRQRLLKIRQLCKCMTKLARLSRCTSFKNNLSSVDTLLKTAKKITPNCLGTAHPPGYAVIKGLASSANPVQANRVCSQTSLLLHRRASAIQFLNIIPRHLLPGKPLRLCICGDFLEGFGIYLVHS